MDYALVSRGVLLVQEYQSHYFLISLGKPTNKPRVLCQHFPLKTRFCPYKGCLH